MAKTKTNLPTLGDDLLLGVNAIARELGVTPRIASYYHEIRAIPSFKLGGKVACRRSEVDQTLRARPLNGEG